MTPPVLVLCSASPRRRELLRSLGLSFEVEAPHLDESRKPGEPPAALAERLAREKAMAGLAAFHARSPVRAVAIAADTVVAVGDADLGKPAGRDDAARMLRALSGRVHRVTSGVCVAGPTEPQDAECALRSIAVSTEVRFRRLSEAEIAWLAASGDGDDKAGGYALQGLAGAFIERIEGSVTSVIGLPLVETLGLLAEAGVRLPWEAK